MSTPLTRALHSQHTFAMKIHWFWKIALVCFFLSCKAKNLRAQANNVKAAQPFIAVAPKAALPPIVVSYDPQNKRGINWERLSRLSHQQVTQDAGASGYFAVRYLGEAIFRMSGKQLPVVTATNEAAYSRGIILTTLADAPTDLKNDPEVLAALRNTGKDSYNNSEAYFLRSEPNRVVVVANTQDGLCNGVVELLESVEYEVLGMGPNWTHIPNYKTRALTFSIRQAGRPGFYFRNIHATSGQQAGIGTLTQAQIWDAADEAVEVSYYDRWLVGARLFTQSMPRFPGHALQAYHGPVAEEMRKRKTTDGLLTPKTFFAPDAERPAASPQNAFHAWINSDAEGQPGAGKSYYSDGAKWEPGVVASLDLSVPLVRETILADMKVQAEASFTRSPDEIFVFGTDPEDGGGLNDFATQVKYPNWYPEYLKSQGDTLGKPYVLNGFKGLNQPKEIWDPKSVSDTVFGFNNWLLREYDKYIDSLPAKDRVTASGKSKKELVRASLYSYNYHDVPPNFNLDPRIRAMIASYPKHRGQGKWKNFASQSDMGKAFKVMLSREPSGDYWIISLALYTDASASDISGSDNAATIQHNIRDAYDSGFKALSVETDFNFGKKGMAYYLYSKMLWNPDLTAAELDAIRTRWLQRAFGTGWREMKEYYDFMTPQKFTISSPNNWAKAIRMIDAADAKIDDKSDAQKRIDDVKQFWYFYYLQESGQHKPITREFREFVWKGQMSYMTAMFAVTQRLFNSSSAADVAGEEFNTGRAHYTHEETQQWWAKVLDRWKVTPVNEFADAVLANGKKAGDIDVYDLVRVKEFQAPQFAAKSWEAAFLYNSTEWIEPTFTTVASAAGDEIGFKLLWPWYPNDVNYVARPVQYGISRWNTAEKKWDDLVDKNMMTQQSEPTAAPTAWRWNMIHQVVTVRYKAPTAGVYRFNVGRGGNAALLGTLSFDETTGEDAHTQAHTYIGSTIGLTQSPTYIYIPKGTKSLDMEVWKTGSKQLWFTDSLPSAGFNRTRSVDVTAVGTHTVKLLPGEDGTIVMLISDNFGFPHLYSIPTLWSKSPEALLVPRAIAEADGLTILK